MTLDNMLTQIKKDREGLVKENKRRLEADNAELRERIARLEFDMAWGSPDSPHWGPKS